MILYLKFHLRNLHIMWSNHTTYNKTSTVFEQSSVQLKCEMTRDELFAMKIVERKKNNKIVTFPASVSAIQSSVSNMRQTTDEMIIVYLIEVDLIIMCNLIS